MSVRWRLEYIDDFGHNIRTDISEPDYEGPIIPVDGVGYSPVQIAIESQNDRKEKVIKGTSIEVSMFSMSDFQFQDIAEGTERQFLVEHFQDDNLKHAGFVIPEVYSEPYEQPPYPVTIRATSIGAIKNQPYKSGLTPINTTLLSVIRQCVNTAPLINNIWESIDITHEGQTGATLEDIRIDESAFLETQRGRVKWKSKHDVLEEVLRPFGVNFFQDFGRWVIVPFDKRTQSRTVRQYGLLAGGVQSTFTHDPEIASFDFVNVNHNLDKQPAASSILCTYEHGVSPTFATGFNDDFQEETWGIQQSTELPEGWSLITQPGSGSDFTGQRFLSPDLGGPGVLFFEGNAFFDGIEFTRSNFLRNSAQDTISVNFRFATFVSGETTSETRFQIRIGDYYLLADGSWTTTESNIVFEDVNRFFPAGGVSSAYSDFDLESSPIPEDGDFKATIFSSIEDQNSDRQIFVYFDVVHNPEGRPQPQSTSFIGERDIDSFSEEIDIQTQYGDAPSILHENTFIFDGSQTNDWNRGAQSGTLQELLIQSVADEYQFPISLINGTFKIDGLFDIYLSHKGKKYILNGGRYTERQGYFDGQIIESGLGASSIGIDRFFEPQTGRTGAVASGSTGGGSGITESEADDRYFRQSQLLSEASNFATLRANIGLEIGSDVQAYSANLDSINQNLGTGSAPTFSSLSVTNALSANTLRTDTGKFLSPVDYQFRNAGDTNFRSVQMLGITAADGAFSGSLGINNSNPDSRVHITDTTNLLTLQIDGQARWRFDQGSSIRNLRITQYTGTDDGEFEIDADTRFNRDLKLGSQTVINADRDFFGVNADFTGTLDVGGLSTFESNILYKGSLTSDNFASEAGIYTGADLSQNTLRIETIRANELRVKAFVAEVSAALYGEDILTKSRGVLSRDFTIPDTIGTIYVEDLEGLPNTPVFEIDDWVRLTFVDRSGGGLETATAWGLVDAYTDLGGGEQSWTWNRQSGTTGDVIHAGSVAIDYGTSGDAVIIRSVIGDNTPRDTQLEWTSDPSNPSNYTIISRIGNLGGIPNTSGTGFYGENTFLTGSLLVGDLLKEGNYLEYASGDLTVSGNVNIQDRLFINDSNDSITAPVIEQGGSTTTVNISNEVWESPYLVEDIIRGQAINVKMRFESPNQADFSIRVELVNLDEQATITLWEIPYFLLLSSFGEKEFNFEIISDQIYRGSEFGGGIRIVIDTANVFPSTDSNIDLYEYEITSYTNRSLINTRGFLDRKSPGTILRSDGVTGSYALDLPKRSDFASGYEGWSQLQGQAVLMERGSSSESLPDASQTYTIRYYDVVQVGTVEITS